MAPPQPPDPRASRVAGDDRRQDRRWKSAQADLTRVDARAPSGKDFRRPSVPAPPFGGFHRRDDRVHKDRRWERRRNSRAGRFQDHRAHDSRHDDDVRRVTQKPISPQTLLPAVSRPRADSSDRLSPGPTRDSMVGLTMKPHGVSTPEPANASTASTASARRLPVDPRSNLADSKIRTALARYGTAGPQESARRPESGDRSRVDGTLAESASELARPDAALGGSAAAAHTGEGSAPLPSSNEQPKSSDLARDQDSESSQSDRVPLSGDRQEQSPAGLAAHGEPLGHKSEPTPYGADGKPTAPAALEPADDALINEPMTPAEANSLARSAPNDDTTTLHDIEIPDEPPAAGPSNARTVHAGAEPGDDMVCDDTEAADDNAPVKPAETEKGALDEQPIETEAEAMHADSPVASDVAPDALVHSEVGPQEDEPDAGFVDPPAPPRATLDFSARDMHTQVLPPRPARVLVDHPQPEDALPQSRILRAELERTFDTLRAACPPGEYTRKRWLLRPLDSRVAFLLQNRRYGVLTQSISARKRFDAQLHRWHAFVEDLDAQAAEDAAAAIKASAKRVQAAPSPRKRESESYGRRNHRSHTFGDVARSEAEFMEILASLEEQTARDPLVRARLTSARVCDQAPVPPRPFASTNAAVVDKSVLMDRLRRYETDDFTPEEHELFEQAYLKTPKEFGKIADAVGRSFNDCVMHYYRTKKTVGYKGLLLAVGRKKRGRKPKKRDSAPSTPATPALDMESPTSSPGAPVGAALSPAAAQTPAPASALAAAPIPLLPAPSVAVQAPATPPAVPPALPAAPLIALDHVSAAVQASPQAQPPPSPGLAARGLALEAAAPVSDPQSSQLPQPQRQSQSQPQSQPQPPQPLPLLPLPQLSQPPLSQPRLPQPQLPPEAPSQMPPLPPLHSPESSRNEDADATLVAYPHGASPHDLAEPMDALAVAALAQPALVAWLPHDVATLEQLLGVYGSQLAEVARHMNRPVEEVREFIERQAPRFDAFLTTPGAQLAVPRARGPQIGVFSPRAVKQPSRAASPEATPVRAVSVPEPDPATPATLVTRRVFTPWRPPPVPLPLLPQKPVYNYNMFGAIAAYGERFQESNERSRPQC